MKKAITLNLFVIFLIIIFISKATAQKIYSCESKYEADIKVFVVDSKYDADLLVFKGESKYQAEGNKGLWFFTESKYDADLLIYFVESKYDAQWRKRNKMYLIF